MVRTSRNTPETTPSSRSSCPRLWPPPGQARTATSQRHHIRPSVYSCRHRRRMHGTQHGMAQLEWPVPHDANHLWMLLSTQAVSGSVKGEHFVCSTLVLLQAKLSLAEWLPSLSLSLSLSDWGSSAAVHSRAGHHSRSPASSPLNSSSEIHNYQRTITNYRLYTPNRQESPPAMK